MFKKEMNNVELIELTEYLHLTKRIISATAAASIIIKNDKVVYEWYSGFHNKLMSSRKVDEESQFNVGSIRKTYLGLVVSKAIYEGKITSLDARVSDYFYELDKDLLGNTTIRNLLTHTHGLSDKGRLFLPGTNWNYNNIGVNILISIVKDLYGKSFPTLIDELVFSPYGFNESGWRMQEEDKLIWLNDSYHNGNGSDSNLFVSTRDLAQWGYLHLNKGCIKGQQIIPQEVFEQATSIISPSIHENLPRNGYYWFVQDMARQKSEIGDLLPKDTFQSLGITGCVCLIIPTINTVAVRMYNQTGPNPVGYNYLKDIKYFGDLVYTNLKKLEI